MPKENGKAIAQVEVDLTLPPDQDEALLMILKARFEENLPHRQASMKRHEGIEWSEVEGRLKADRQKLKSLNAMEQTGGEPDVIGYDKKTDEYLFCDCSEQSPLRRSICYDRAGEEAREKKGVYPGGNAIDLAEAMRIELLNEAQYRELQELGVFDTTTSSWIQTPEKIRKLGGALFCDRRYDTVFVYHNGADSFYGARGFRGLLRV
jgi:hypothetical protein